MLGVGAKFSSKNFLYGIQELIKDQTKFGMPRGAKMNLVPNVPILTCHSFKHPHQLQACAETYRTSKASYAE